MIIYSSTNQRRNLMSVSEQTKTELTLPSDREIVITRTFEGPRDLLWQMYTRAEHLVHWWGPTGWTLPVCEVDFRPGGTWFYCMESPDGTRSCGKTFYLEIDEPDRMVYRDIFVDPDGNPLEGMPEAESTVEFIEKDGRTTVVSTVLYPTKADRDKVIEMGMEAGIDQTLDRLEAYLLEIR
jgi:uncharacterized protein YndB with AHSA1/START domain